MEQAEDQARRSSVSATHQCEKPDAAEASRSAKGGDPASSASLDLECACCSDVLLEPVVAPCGHDMCLACYTKWCQASCLSTGFPACPLCRAPMPTSLRVCVRLKRVVESLQPAATKRRRLDQEASSAVSTTCWPAASAQQCTTGSQQQQPQPAWWWQLPPALQHCWPRAPPASSSASPSLTRQFEEYAQYQQVAMLAGMYANYHHHSVAHQQHQLQQQWGSSTWHVAAVQGSIVTGTPVLGTPVADLAAHAPQPAPGDAPLAPAAACFNPPPLTAAMQSTRSSPSHTTVPAPASSSTRVPRPPGATSTSTSRLQPQPQPLPARWQSMEDVPLRLDCARRLVALLQQQASSAGAAGAAAWARMQLAATSTSTHSAITPSAASLPSEWASAAAAAPAPGSASAAAGAPEPALLGVVRAIEVHLYRQAPSRQAYADVATLQQRMMAFVRRRLEVARERRRVGLASAEQR